MGAAVGALVGFGVGSQDDGFDVIDILVILFGLTLMLAE